MIALLFFVISAQTVSFPSGQITLGFSDADVQSAYALCLRDGTIEDCLEWRRVEAYYQGHARTEWVPSFRIDAKEVTVAQWNECVRALRCPPPRFRDVDERFARPELPMTRVTQTEAERYCAYRGGRLPTEAEWEWAASAGRRGLTFPWGNVWNDRLANYGGSEPEDDGFRWLAPAGSYPNERGIYDLAGNVWELTASQTQIRVDGAVVEEGVVIRGGSFRSPAAQVRVKARRVLAHNGSRLDVGFRCVF